MNRVTESAPSIQRRLLWFLLPPLAALMLVGVYANYRAAMAFVESAYDERLGDAAVALAGSLLKDGPRLRVDSSAVPATAHRADHLVALRYAIVGAGGELLAGSREVPVAAASLSANPDLRRRDRRGRAPARRQLPGQHRQHRGRHQRRRIRGPARRAGPLHPGEHLAAGLHPARRDAADRLARRALRTQAAAVAAPADRGRLAARVQTSGCGHGAGGSEAAGGGAQCAVRRARRSRALPAAVRGRYGAPAAHADHGPARRISNC